MMVTPLVAASGAPSRSGQRRLSLEAYQNPHPQPLPQLKVGEGVGKSLSHN
jgi:hypothetical protein